MVFQNLPKLVSSTTNCRELRSGINVHLGMMMEAVASVPSESDSPPSLPRGVLVVTASVLRHGNTSRHRDGVEREEQSMKTRQLRSTGEIGPVQAVSYTLGITMQTWTLNNPAQLVQPRHLSRGNLRSRRLK